MLLSAMSRRCPLHRATGSRALLWAWSCARSPGSTASLSAWSCAGLPGLQPVHGGLSRRHTDFCWLVHSPRPPCRGISSGTPSSEGQLIYTGSLGTAVRGVKAFSYSTSGASLLIMPQLLLTTGLGAQSWAFQLMFCGVIGAFTFVTPILLHLVTKGYVVRLYHHPERDTYTAVTYSVFLTEKRTVFHQGQVRIPNVSKMFTTFYADRMGLLVNPDLFSVPQDYNHLMGYDKPFNFSPEGMDKS